MTGNACRAEEIIVIASAVFGLVLFLAAVIYYNVKRSQQEDGPRSRRPSAARRSPSRQHEGFLEIVQRCSGSMVQGLGDAWKRLIRSSEEPVALDSQVTASLRNYSLQTPAKRNRMENGNINDNEASESPIAVVATARDANGKANGARERLKEPQLSDSTDGDCDLEAQDLEED
ncbi:hypothetical protein CDD81_4139 [Ophiocordyceps australis]|uniref:Uncharacterized protein n=1 Tax=Ophiocordyceps australis TaxID=1399860 RepID=A0A2C5XJB4_9HYPO|nr:hypothetical protein CDD81_4139 [Ophiocordyceps australis]